MTQPETAVAKPIRAVETMMLRRPRRVVTSSALFADRQEVVIVHGSDEYRLRITKAGKLILTK